ncbi:hypothetical protein JMUB5695_03716 [Mycobacterium heckeshornense]|uniref:Uncharacterized protein n=1 Tax=Mycobacterium heckeshornense TaxID=110505 RepID=A0A7R7YSM4_9MYCO|nr:hypothetical protein MHEC_38170 [Mycobacterium heckeshornense]BCQ10261.1 hypothetical protein JMUB5695_03716 [Mycobacterium heckeshornense]
MAALRSLADMRLPGLTTVGRFKDRVRQAITVITRPGNSPRDAVFSRAPGPSRSTRLAGGRDLPLIRPGVERC